MVIILYTDYKLNDENVKDYQKLEYIINTIKNQFNTYGYKQIKTPAFEQYDLYSIVTSSIDQNEMIKIVDYTGDVLVLRPDITIPITRRLAQEKDKLTQERRYFYIQDIFRQSFERGKQIENTQAGIECFGAASAEIDAEVIALACDTLSELRLSDIKIEMGDAGFFQELIKSLNLSENQQTDLRKLIQAKNAVDIKPFLERLDVEQEIADSIASIPFLYGNTDKVLKKARKIYNTEIMIKKLNHLEEVYSILKMYGLEDKVILDLGLINHMGYYSDIIFQGFVGEIGEPVLMGGRYDKLAEEFGSSIKAIGFACKVDTLLKAVEEDLLPKLTLHDIHVCYEKDEMTEAIDFTRQARKQNYSVVTYTDEQKQLDPSCTYLVQIEKGNYLLETNGKIEHFSGIEAILKKIGVN